MAIVVNDPANLPARIIVIPVEKINRLGISTRFLDDVIKHPTANSGIKRNRYYMIKPDSILRHRDLNREYLLFLKLLELAERHSFQLIQINF